MSLVNPLTRQGLKAAPSRRAMMECVANDLRREVLDLATEIQAVDPLIGSKFVRPLRAYPAGYRVVRAASDQAFQLKDIEGVIELNAGGLDLMMREVSRASIDRPLRDDIRRILVELYVLHELRHISQGIAAFESVQDIKLNVGLQALGELDLMADIDAARVLAALRAHREGLNGRGPYILKLREVVFVMGEYALKAFGAPLDKPHKVYRGLGIAAVAARLDAAIEGKNIHEVEERVGPLDSVLWPVFQSMDNLTLIGLTPQREVIRSRIPVDPKSFQALCEGIDEWPFADSVQHLKAILRASSLLS